MNSKGLVALYALAQPSATSSRSATNWMYCAMSRAFMPIRSTGSASQQNSCGRGRGGGRGKHA
jgi:hypothetical protein